MKNNRREESTAASAHTEGRVGLTETHSCQNSFSILILCCVGMVLEQGPLQLAEASIILLINTGTEWWRTLRRLCEEEEGEEESTNNNEAPAIS